MCRRNRLGLEGPRQKGTSRAVRVTSWERPRIHVVKLERRADMPVVFVVV